MNEQDIIKRIENKTKDLPIPDSISPSNMEKMLNEHVNGTIDNSSDADVAANSDNADARTTNLNKTIDIHDGRTAATNTNSINYNNSTARKRLALAFAACLGVIIIGSGAATIIKHNSTEESYKTAMTEAAFDSDYAESESADEAVMDEAANESAGAASDTTYDSEAEDEEIGRELALAGDLHQAESYDEYYDAVKAGYDNYMSKFYDTDIGAEYNDVYITDTTEAAFEDGLQAESDGIFDTAIEEAAPADEAASDYNMSDSAGGSVSDLAITNGADTRGTASAKSTDSTKQSESDKDYSTTNTQEKAVDEGDIVKTDGEYIYVAHTGSYDFSPYITITKAGKNGSLDNVSSIELPEISGKSPTLHEIYLYKDYLVALYSCTYTDDRHLSSSTYTDIYNDYRYDPGITKSFISIYNIKNKDNIELVKTLSQSGYYEGSRISGGFLYTISNFNRRNAVFESNEKDSQKAYEEYIPFLNDDKLPVSNLYYSDHLENMSTYVVTSVDLSKPDSFADSKGVSTSDAQLYVGEESIYLYSSVYDNIQKTELLKIGYSKGRLTVGSRAVIAGYLYGSFALSEYNGDLRIVSTIPANNFSWYRTGVFTNSGSDENTVRLNEDINALYVLDENMHLIGRLTGLAPGEQIYSARFMGDIGYFVTYRNTDPLFSVDLSNPREPKILGALKIPGFSNYLHFYGDNILLGLGEEHDPVSSEFYGLKLSMFDISDPSNVTENDKYVMYDTYSSPAQYQHKALMIDSGKNVFGFCYDAEEITSANGNTASEYYSYGYYYSTFTYDENKGFIRTATYRLDYDYMYDIEDVRGLFIGDYFYLVTPTSIESYRLGDTERIDIVGA